MPSRPETMSSMTPTLDEVFLSPRVVDQRAFEEFSSVLKGLVEDASNQSRLLVNTSGEVKRLGEHLREATRELQGKVDTAVRVVPTIDSRVAKAEAILERTTTELATKEQQVRELVARETVIDKAMVQELVRQQIVGVIEQALAQFSKELLERSSAGVWHASAEVERLLEKLRTTQAKLDLGFAAIEQKAESVTQEFDHHTQRLQARSESASEQIIKTAELKASQLIAKAETKAAEIESALETRLASAVNRAHERLEEQIKAMPASMQPLEDRAGLIVAELEKRVARSKSQADSVVQALEGVDAERLEKAAVAAKSAAGLADNASLSTILEFANRLPDLTRKAEFAVKQLDEVRHQADAARKLLGEAVVDASGGIDTVTRRLQELKRGQDALREAFSEVSVQTQQAVVSLESKTREAHQALEAAAQPILTTQARQIKQIGDWLNQLTTQASEVGRMLERLVREARGQTAPRPPV